MQRTIMRGMFLGWMAFGINTASHADTVTDSNAADQSRATYIQEEIGGAQLDDANVSKNGIELIATSDKSTASIKLKPRLGNMNLSILFSTPLDKKTKEGRFYDTDAFGNGSSATFNIQNLIFGDPLDVDPVDMVEIQDTCTENPRLFDIAPDKKDQCQTTVLDKLVQTYLKKQQPALVADIFNKVNTYLLKPLHLWGFTATIAREKLDYLKTDSIEKDDTIEKPWGTSAYYTFVQPTKRMISVELAYQEAYKPNSSITVCQNTPGPNGLLPCATGANGGPKKNINRNITLLLRESMGDMAISPKIIHDTEDHSTAFTMPVHFFKNDKDQLTGGISASWEDTKHEWTFGLFVGSAFKVF